MSFRGTLLDPVVWLILAIFENHLTARCHIWPVATTARETSAPSSAWQQRSAAPPADWRGTTASAFWSEARQSGVLFKGTTQECIPLWCSVIISRFIFLWWVWIGHILCSWVDTLHDGETAENMQQFWAVFPCWMFLTRKNMLCYLNVVDCKTL